MVTSVDTIYNTFAPLFGAEELSKLSELPRIVSTQEEPIEDISPKLGTFIPPPITMKPISTSNISFEDLIKQENLPIKITSGYRGKDGFRGGKTASGKQSNHNKLDSQGNPLAYDIQPFFGGKIDRSTEGFNKLLNILYSNQRVVNWLQDNNRGILEEFTPEVMKKTGATGPHLHIGPDSSAVQMTLNRLQNYVG